MKLNIEKLKKGNVIKAQEGSLMNSDEKYSAGNQGQLSQIGKKGIKTKKKLINKRK